MSKLKVASDNRKKKPKKPSNENYQVKTISTPKYLKIKGTKVLNPSDIKLLDFGGYLVFGDPKIKGAKFEVETLEQCKKNNEIIVLLKTTKQKNGSTVYAFSEKVEIVRSYRKMRLANAGHLQVLGEATNKPHQTQEEFMNEELESSFLNKEELDAYFNQKEKELIDLFKSKNSNEQELKDGKLLEFAYLECNKPFLIEKDIERLIHLMHQQYVQDSTGVPRKDTKLGIAKD